VIFAGVSDLRDNISLMPANRGSNAPARQETTDRQFRSKDMNSIDREGHGAGVNQARRR
jgi:hypothetical protein